MKTGYSLLLTTFVVVLVICTIFGCKKFESPNSKPETLSLGQKSSSVSLLAVADQGLIAYKQSAHQLSMGYYSVSGSGWLSIPDSVDIVDNWGNGPFNDTANNFPYIRQIQNEKGTRVVHCAWPPNSNNTQAYYDQWVQNQYNQIVVQAGMDGMDLDMESGLLNQMSSSNRVAFMNSVIKYFGKTSQYTVPRTGKKPLLVYGTDASIGTSLLNQFASSVDYVMFQAYADPGDYWQGNLNNLSSAMSSYNAGSNSKFIAVANGESGYAWNVNSTVGGTRPQIIEYAYWCKQNGAGGVGAYHQEADFSHTPPYTYTKQTIQILNSTGGGGATTITSGATYSLVTGINNSSVIDVTGSGTANGTKLILWTPNSPISNNQKWKVTDVGGGYYKLQPMHATSKAMTLSSTTNGTQLTISSDNGSTAQKWQITSVGSGYYTLTPAGASGSRVDAEGNTSADNTKIITWSANSPVSNNQKWKFVQQ